MDDSRDSAFRSVSESALAYLKDEREALFARALAEANEALAKARAATKNLHGLAKVLNHSDQGNFHWVDDHVRQAQKRMPGYDGWNAP